MTSPNELSGELAPTSFVDNCRSCGSWTRLRAYESKKIVRIGLPIKQTGAVHVDGRCDICGAMTMIEGREWEGQKAQILAQAAQGEAAVVDPAQAAQLLMGLAHVHARDAFLPLASRVEQRFPGDLQVLKALRFAYDRFDMGVAAERVAVQIVQLEDNPDNRRMLARVYLRLQKPAEAEQTLSGQEHTPEGTRHLVLVAELYALLGMAPNALSLLGRLDQQNPGVIEVTGLVQMHQAGGPLQHVRYLPTPAERAPFEIPKSAASPGCLWAVGAVAGLFILGFIVLAMVFAEEDVVFVNGTQVPYTIEVAGQTHTLNPGRTVIKLSDDVHEVKAFIGTEREFTFPVNVDVLGEYKKHIVNPDRSAVMRFETSEYRVVNTKNDFYKQEFFAGDLEYILEADYFFVDFPSTISMEGSSERRYRVSIWDSAKKGWITPSEVMLKDKNIGLAGLLNVLRLRLTHDPKDQFALEELVYQWKDKPALRGFLSSRLDERPALIAWHKAFVRAGYAAKAAYRDRPIAEDEPCLLALHAKVSQDADQKKDLFARSTAGDQACDLALNEHAFYQALMGNSRAAKKLLARGKIDIGYRTPRDQAHLLIGDERAVLKERAKQNDFEKRAIDAWVNYIDGKKRKGDQLVNRLRQSKGYWTDWASNKQILAGSNKAALRAMKNADVDFSLMVIGGRVKAAGETLLDGTAEAHFIVAAHALKNKDKALAKFHEQKALATWNSAEAVEMLSSKKAPSLAAARKLGSELGNARGFMAYLGMKYKKKRKTFFKEADRLMTDLSWSTLAIRGLPGRWRQGSIR